MLACVMNPCLAFLTHWSSFGNHSSFPAWNAYKFILLGYKYCSWKNFCITPSPQYPGPLPLDSWPSRCSLSGLSSRSIFVPALALSTAFMDTLHHTTRQGPGSRFALTPPSPRLSCTHLHSSWPWFLPGSIWELNPAFSPCCWWGWIESSSTQVKLNKSSNSEMMKVSK